MGGDWLLSGLYAGTNISVYSGLQLYWGVRRMVCSDDEEDTRQTGVGQGQAQGIAAGWSQQQENNKANSFNGNKSAQSSFSSRQTWQSGSSKRQTLPVIEEGQEMDVDWSKTKENNRYGSNGGNSFVQGSSSTRQMW